MTEAAPSAHFHEVAYGRKTARARAESMPRNIAVEIPMHPANMSAGKAPAQTPVTSRGPTWR